MTGASGPASRGDRPTSRIPAEKDRRGWRLKVGVAVPSTNTIVQPDFDDLRPEGVTNHVSRIAIPNVPIASDEDFDALIRASAAGLDEAIDRVMTAEPDVLVVGMSSLLVWDGHDAARRRKEGIEARTGKPVGGGSFAVAEALERLGARRIAILSPYMPVADRHITAFFADQGFDVVRFHGLRCPSPTAIAAVPPETLIAGLDVLDGGDIEALVQFGTNLDFLPIAETEAAKRGKPVLAINRVSYEQALRLGGVAEGPG